MKPQFPWLHPRSLSETHRGVGELRHKTSALQIFQLVLPPAVLPQELRRYGPQSATLRPLVLSNLSHPGSLAWPDILVFPPRSTRCLRLCHPKRCVPNREEPFLQPANTQNFDVLTVQLNPTRSVRLQKDCVQNSRAIPHAIVLRLVRAYH